MTGLYHCFVVDTSLCFTVIPRALGIGGTRVVVLMGNLTGTRGSCQRGASVKSSCGGRMTMSGLASCSGGGSRNGYRASCKERVWNARRMRRRSGGHCAPSSDLTISFGLNLDISAVHDPIGSGMLGIDVPHAIINGDCLLFCGGLVLIAVCAIHFGNQVVRHPFEIKSVYAIMNHVMTFVCLSIKDSLI